jgi:polyhydroxybutyrate depolymerase
LPDTVGWVGRSVVVALAGLLLAACTSTSAVDRPAGPGVSRPAPKVSPSSSASAAGRACRTTALHQQHFDIRVGGVQRSYLLSVAAGAGPRPLVILFHGFDETARFIDRYTQLPRAGVAAGFAVATPSGYGERWNFPRRRSIGPDDVQFVRRLIRAVAAKVCLDRAGIFVTGFSDGADMADTVACFVPGVRAVAGVAASVPVRGCARRVDVLQIHGDADPVVPYLGGGGDRPPPFEGEEAVSVAEQMRSWRRLDGCDATPAEPVTLRGGIRQIAGRRCASARQVLLLEVRGGGHTWPGASVELPYGATNHAMSATKRILYFFEQILRG